MTFVKMTLSGGVFIFAIAVFRALTLRRLPKQTFVALWWAAALRLLLPLELPSRLSVYTLLEALRPKAAAPVIPTAPAASAAMPPSRVLVIPIQPEAAPQPVSPTVSPPVSVWTILWLAGAALMALWFLVSYIRWRRRFRESLPTDCPGLETWFRLRRTVQLRTTDQIAVPLTYGVFRPVILLPKALDLRDEDALTCVLAHELAHIRHLDSLFKLVLAAALCVHWFNPAAWLFYVLANRDMELRCDEAAVLALGGDSRERYALALIRLAENESVPLCGFSQKNGMEERIKAIMRIKKKSLAVCAAALVLALGITTAFATSAKPAEANAPGQEDLTGGEYEAKVSAEVAAQWDELLAPYVPFGLRYTFDDPDHDGNGLTMTYEGREVRGIFDGKTGEWIAEHAGLGSYSPDAVELYAMYDENGLTGLRFATEDEQAAFTEARKDAMNAARLEMLGESVRYEDGSVYFTVPEGEERWSIWISGRIATKDGMGQSCHYLESESEKAEWIPGGTYSFKVSEAAYDELTMEAAYGKESRSFDLTLFLPKDSRPLALPELPEGKAEVPEDGTMVWPVDGGTVSQTQGIWTHPGVEDALSHNGVDIAGLAKGAPIYAAAAGTVDAAGWQNDLGNYVLLLHENQLVTLYAHCDSILVKQNDQVKAGQTIATVGSTGLSTGPHLHFQVLADGENRNPLEFFPYWDVAQSVTKVQGEGEGYPVYAADTGHVTGAGWDEKYGYYVEISQDDQNEGRPRNITRYSNCGEIHVKPGDWVQQGDLIANVGVEPLRVEYDVESIYQMNWLEEMTEKYLVNGAYPKNSKGQTYGPYLYDLVENLPDLQKVDENWPDWTEPDLEEGYISNNVKWVYNSTLGTMTRSDVTIGENGRLYVPLYDVEGNQIGLYQWW